VVTECFGESVLVCGLQRVVELLVDPQPDLARQRVDVETGQRSADQAHQQREVLMSARTAAATPGYWTLTATSRPSVKAARYTWPIEATPSGR